MTWFHWTWLVGGLLVFVAGIVSDAWNDSEGDDCITGPAFAVGLFLPLVVVLLAAIAPFGAIYATAQVIRDRVRPRPDKYQTLAEKEADALLDGAA